MKTIHYDYYSVQVYESNIIIIKYLLRDQWIPMQSQQKYLNSQISTRSKWFALLQQTDNKPHKFILD